MRLTQAVFTFLVCWGLLAAPLAAGSVAVEPEYAQDDECASGDDSCSVSLLQIAEQTKAASAKTTVERMVSHPGFALSSSFFEGSGPSPSGTCSVKALKGPANYNSMLVHGFGHGGGGQSWQYSGLVVSDGPPKNQVDFNQPVLLKVEVHAKPASWTMQSSTINVGGLEEEPADVQWSASGSADCPPALCLPPRPSCAGLVGVPAKPPCGWAAEAEAVVSKGGMPAGETGTLLFDISELVAANYSSFKIWAAPSELNRGMWQIPEQIVTSWGFIWLPLEIPI
mmetsp:Transcript_106649/g.270834  ORF Transcript_106649/g.270834 Transcript_106649/m.270834 type:complete len:282 (+) Transcript_106649:74-919(+)